jgi:hypothetical protein
VSSLPAVAPPFVACTSYARSGLLSTRRAPTVFEIVLTPLPSTRTARKS